MRYVHLGLASGNDGVAGNEFGENTAGGLDTECQGANVDENDVLSTLLTGQDTTLDGGTVGNGLIGVDTLGRLLATEELLEELLNLGDTSRTSDENDLEIETLVSV